jgi:V8-like Glu-specific endopeptidase
MAMGVAPMVLAATVFAEGIEDVPTRGVKRAASEVAVGGLTPQQYFAEQRALHEWLTAELPRGAERATVRVGITEQDMQDITAAPAELAPMRVGVVKPIPDRVGLMRGQALGQRGKTATSVLQRTAEDGYVWTSTITSPGAVAIRVQFKDFSLPGGAEAFFFSPNGEAYGPYLGAGPDGTGEFWSHSVESSTGVVLVRFHGPVDADDLRAGSFRITDIAHVALDFPGQPDEADAGGVASFCQYNASCVENASCTSQSAVNDAKGAAAKMRWISGAFVYICSGGLIADTDSSTQIPYFLTANHCISKSKDANNLECYFQFSVSCGTSTCPGSFDPAPSPKTMGSTIRATGSTGDFTLLQLAQNPPSGSVFMGWNNSPVAFTSGLVLHRISHPSGAPQAYSRHEVDTAIGTCLNTARGPWIYSDNVFGAVEGGSSGSPVVNGSGEVVGQLTGCCPAGGGDCNDVCHSNNHTIDGALAYYWSSVEQFLDPDGGGGTGCSSNADCNDGDACTTDVCNPDGTCSNTAPSCGPSDGCCPSGCSSSNDPDCTSCGGNQAPCSSNADCCSGNCRSGTCRGN